MNPRLAAELPHLLSLCKSGTGWQIFAREKADDLAAQEPQTWGDLPMLLSNAVHLSKFGPPRKSSKAFTPTPQLTDEPRSES